MNKEAILEGLLFVVGDEGITLDNIVEIMAITKKEAQELLKNCLLYTSPSPRDCS